jgi:hypothetical protein
MAQNIDQSTAGDPLPSDLMHDTPKSAVILASYHCRKDPG